MKLDNIEVQELSLPGVLLITPKLFFDERGFFSEIYSPQVFEQIGIKDDFIQDSISYSVKNVLRGLHYQKSPHGQSKLVRCSSGEIFDVAVDFNKESETFGKHCSAILAGDKQSMLYIPAKYAHGFCVLSDEAIVNYKLSGEHFPQFARTIHYADPVFNIKWPINEPILSTKDKEASFLQYE